MNGNLKKHTGLPCKDPVSRKRERRELKRARSRERYDNDSSDDQWQPWKERTGITKQGRKIKLRSTAHSEER